MNKKFKTNELVISFIIPAYNTEVDVLKRGILSIEQQIPQNKEILIIDDGSETSISEQYDSLSKELNDVCVHHIINAGAANARNVGIEKSKGTYIVFVDADDFLPNNGSILEMIGIMEEEDLDFIVGAHKDMRGDYDVKLTAKEAQLIILKQQSIYGYIELGSPWAKMFRRSFLIQNNIRFNPKLRRSHDRLFMMNALEVTKSFKVRNIYCYCFCTAIGNSLSRSYNNKTSEYMAVFYDAMKSFVQINHKNEDAYTNALKDLFTIVHRQCAHQVYFHPLNKNPFFQRYKGFKKLKCYLGNETVGIVTYRGISMIIYSLLLKLRLFFLLSIILEINKYRY